VPAAAGGTGGAHHARNHQAWRVSSSLEPAAIAAGSPG
jgi:hypothetical protein